MNEEELKKYFKPEEIELLNQQRMTQRTDLIMDRVPSFCTRCEEIRGVNSKTATLMINTAQTMAWKSFGMCEACNAFIRDYPEQAANNQANFKLRKAEENQKKLEDQKAYRFRVYFLDNEKLPISSYATSITDIRFTRYPSETPKGLANKSIPLLTEEKAKAIMITLLAHDISAWYDDSEYQTALTTN